MDNLTATQSAVIHRANLSDLIKAAALLHLRTAKYSQPDPAYTAGLLAGLETIAAGAGLPGLVGELGRLLPGGER